MSSSSPPPVASRWTPLVFSVVMGAVAASVVPWISHGLGPHGGLFPAILAVVACLDLLSAYLLLQQFRAEGTLRVLAMAGAYTWSLVLLAGYAGAFPDVVSAHPALATAPSVAAWLWVIWHTSFPVLLGLAWAPWPPGLPDLCRPGRRRAVAWASQLVLAGAALGVVAVVVTHGMALPVLIHGRDIGRLTTLTAPVTLPLVGLSAVVTAWGVRGRSGPERWTSAVVWVCLLDLTLTYWSRLRYSVGWYAGRGLTVVAAGVVLLAMLRETTALKRRLAETLERERRIEDLQRAERVEAAAQLSHQAMHDTLTGLPNRALLLDRLNLALVRAEHAQQPCALLFIDLDRFKEINDTLGHAAGDHVLIEIAERLSNAVRPADSVARLGGDEFVVLAESNGAASAQRIAERVRAALTDPIAVAGRTVTVGCSIGIAISDHHTPEALLQEADLALYRAKGAGRNRWEVYDQAMRTQAQHRLRTEHLLRNAVSGQGLVVHYQPIVDLASGRVVGTEALVRIRDPHGPLVPPDEFIGIAEECGLIVALGAAVLLEACRQQARWRDAGTGMGHVAVNVSARQLAFPGFAATVADTLAGAGLPATMLCIELTESALIDAGTVAQQEILALKALGVSLALDDFGTGWSSLAYLRRFPFDIVKIDRSFVSGLGVDNEDTEVVKSVISLGRALGLRTLAEGIETEEQGRLLAELGCDQAQGYFYGRPVAPDDLAARPARLVSVRRGEAGEHGEMTDVAGRQSRSVTEAVAAMAKSAASTVGSSTV